MGFMISVKQMVTGVTKPLGTVGTVSLNFLGRISEGSHWAYYLLIPSLLLVLAIILYPVGSGILLSFREMRLNRPALGTGFVGLRQYAELLADPVFKTAL